MKIAVASDHGGYDFKLKLVNWLKDKRIEVLDFGTDSNKSCDYPDYGIPATHSVAKGEVDLGILICNNGIGMSILANKIAGIKAALVYSESSAKATKEHHNSNILCLGGQEFKESELINFVSIWLESNFQGARHTRRITKVENLDL
jgi:ribose 5-phosphate isomerase B